MNYCADPFSYQRRISREVRVGNVGVGGDNPIRVQSMITCDTMDTEASIAQTIELAEAGCEIVRITAPTVKDAANLQHIVRGLRERGCNVPIVADIHFKPEAAMESAKWVDKVRINPGNYADSKKFKIKPFSMPKLCSRLLMFFSILLLNTQTMAQDFSDGEKAEMADSMRSNGKIYVVVAVVLVILVGLIVYLVGLDRKISRLEKEKT